VSPDFVQFTEAARQRRPRVALVLGSGLGQLADRLVHTIAVPFQQLPDMDNPSIRGHRGTLLLGAWAEQTVLIFAGRLHAYEGHAWRRVVQPIHIARALGAEVLLVTNAAGGIRADLNPGDLMAIHAHIEWTRPACWQVARSRHASPYSPRLIDMLQRAAKRTGFALPQGVYAQVTGPSYETPAEIRALRAWGADAVGMSTAREVQTGADLGMQCAAISCITNRAAGLSAGPINHEEVLAAAPHERLAALIEAFLIELASESADLSER
jgi:purine-nucleoside phosphorylase